MIKRTVIYALIIIAFYTILIIYLRPERYIPQTQWQENSIRAQKYLYGGKWKTVVVGSSLSARLDLSSRQDYYNLAFSGQSAFDGLAIIEHKSQLPERVLIEINTLNVAQGDEFLASQFSPILYQFRKANIAFRDGKQPLAFAAVTLANVFRNSKPMDSQVINERRRLLRDQMIHDQVDKYSDTTKFSNIKESVTVLKNYVSRLRSRGVEVIFFEMPVDKVLCGLPKSRIVREQVLKMFPHEQFRLIPQPDCNSYLTSDGIHLNYQAAKKFTRYLLDETGEKNEGIK